MKPFQLAIALALTSLPVVPSLAETEATARLETEIESFELDGLIGTMVGVTHDNTPIPAFISKEDLDPGSKKFRILVIGGLDSDSVSVRTALSATAWFQQETVNRQHFAFSCIPCARPDAWIGSRKLAESYPPQGNAYNQPGSDVAHYLWRWIGMHAPDLAIVIRRSESKRWTGSLPPEFGFLDRLIAEGGFDFAPETSLARALGARKPAEVDSIPAVICDIPEGVSGKEAVVEVLATALTWKNINGSLPASSARKELQRRIARTPIEVARDLAEVYGRKLDSIAYIPSLAVIGQRRLGELTDDPDRIREAQQLAEPFRTSEKNPVAKRFGGSQLSGHLVFSHLAERTGDDSWTKLAQTAADYGFDENGKPMESMPFHNEMSDSVFMGCAILAEVGKLTGDRKYVDQCLRHLKFMQNLCLRDDGIYRHSPLDEAAWGRGNGFPALGMALSLSALPEESEAFAFFLESYRAHLEALRRHQDPTGMWHQVIDHPESYREFTATCMITFAIVRGIRRGWLEEEEWAPVVERSWPAIKARIGPKGRLVDVCTGTGKQKNLRAYLDRTAILGPDDRGGAMGLMVATEMAFREREK